MLHDDLKTPVSIGSYGSYAVIDPEDLTAVVALMLDALLNSTLARFVSVLCDDLLYLDDLFWSKADPFQDAAVEISHLYACTAI